MEHQDFEDIVFSDIKKGDLLLFHFSRFGLVVSQPLTETISGDEYFYFTYFEFKTHRKRHYFHLIGDINGDIKRLVNK